MFGSDGNKGCCMAAGLYLMIINPGAKKFSAFLAACFCQSSKHLKCRSGPRVRQFSFQRQNYYNGHCCQCCDTFIKPTSVELKIQLLERYFFNTNPIDTLNSLIFVYLPYFWSGELEMVLFCIVSHFLFLVNHSTKLSAARKESLLELTNRINCISRFHIFVILSEKTN